MRNPQQGETEYLTILNVYKGPGRHYVILYYMGLFSATNFDPVSSAASHSCSVSKTDP